MIPNLPPYVLITFILTTLTTFLLLYRLMLRAGATSRRTTFIAVGLLLWLAIQGILTLKGVYSKPSVPPRIVLFGILPPMLTIITLMTTRAGRRFVDSLPLKALTYLNVVRVPVEIVLWWLFQAGAVPKLMTFEGRNFDILAGLTAPIIAYVAFQNGRINRPLLLVWNLVCLGLLVNIVFNALLSAPTPFQQFAFDQPNVGIGYFPFSWLPTFIVPVALLGHLVAVRRLVGASRTMQMAVK